MNIFKSIGHATITFFCSTGKISVFTANSVAAIVKPPIYFRGIATNLFNIGFLSLPVVALTAIFTGAVLALQSYTGFSRFNAESTISTVVALSITRELGPVLAGLMISGRVGAAISAEIASMRVTEQIDALATLSTDPYKYLIAPRILAAVIALPFLVIVADILGIMGGYLIAVYKLGFNPTTYIKNTFEFLEPIDVISGLVKAAVFGFIVSIMGCYNGFYSSKGAQGVGFATTKAVVMGSILILFANYFLTELFFS
ncbi:MAG: ABC transporter permease [Rickettsiales bacterium]|jgi:phospholipid/cholesterol/gamma-HCH transport system permease protein|nr:ABC transporter permease [Rickettsiales bacterium]